MIRITGEDDGWRLDAEQWLPEPPERLWPFFSDAHNLERITPDFLRFRVVTPGPIRVDAGTRIDYRLRIHGIPVRWRSEITAWEPPRRFVDEQIRGPYKRWRHEHRFEPSGGGTRCIDEVRYELFGGPLAPIANRLLVQADVERIFAYRRRALAALFGGDGDAESSEGPSAEDDPGPA